MAVALEKAAASDKVAARAVAAEAKAAAAMPSDSNSENAAEAKEVECVPIARSKTKGAARVEARARETAQQRTEQLFARYEQKMYRVAFAILHDAGQAEDAVMAAFERIVRSGQLPQRAESDQARALVLRVVKQTAIDQYRKNARERKACAPVSFEDLAAGFAFDKALASPGAEDGLHGGVGVSEWVSTRADAGGILPDQASARRDAGPAFGISTDASTCNPFGGDTFDDMVAPLAPAYQDVLRERIGNERTVRETAQRLQISEANVRKRQQRALSMLRKRFGVGAADDTQGAFRE